jgi:hypothetical protein
MLLRRAFPLAISYLLLISAAIAIDYLLHLLDMMWVGRYFGISGTAFLGSSFVYSMRKKKVITSGAMKLFLRIHCNFGWIGTLMILVHSGVHFNAVLPWAATTLMMIVTASGHVGQYLLRKVREEVRLKKKLPDHASMNDDELEKHFYWDSLTISAMEEWRSVHMPLVSLLLALTLVHVFSLMFLWNWR